MQSTSEHRPKMTEIVIENEMLSVPKSVYTSVDTMYHGTKSNITKRLSAVTIRGTPRSGGISATIIEMPPTFIRSKCCEQADITCFSDLAAILYYEVSRLGTDHDRVEIVFNRYFNPLVLNVPFLYP